MLLFQKKKKERKIENAKTLSLWRCCCCLHRASIQQQQSTLLFVVVVNQKASRSTTTWKWVSSRELSLSLTVLSLLVVVGERERICWFFWKKNDAIFYMECTHSLSLALFCRRFLFYTTTTTTLTATVLREREKEIVNKCRIVCLFCFVLTVCIFSFYSSDLTKKKESTSLFGVVMTTLLLLGRRNEFFSERVCSSHQFGHTI